MKAPLSDEKALLLHGHEELRPSHVCRLASDGLEPVFCFIPAPLEPSSHSGRFHREKEPVGREGLSRSGPSFDSGLDVSFLIGTGTH